MSYVYVLNWQITWKRYTVVESASRVKAESNKVKDQRRSGTEAFLPNPILTLVNLWKDEHSPQNISSSSRSSRNLTFPQTLLTTATTSTSPHRHATNMPAFESHIEAMAAN
jgi:hypothetical protein